MARHSVPITVKPDKLQKEAVNGEGAAIDPGDSVSWSSTTDEVEYHGSAGDPGKLIVIDKYNVSLSDSYADGEQLFMYPGETGEEYYMNVTGQNTSGTGTAISIGDELTNYTDGTLCFADSGEAEFVAKEAVSSGSSDQIKVEVL